MSSPCELVIRVVFSLKTLRHSEGLKFMQSVSNLCILLFIQENESFLTWQISVYIKVKMSLTFGIFGMFNFFEKSFSSINQFYFYFSVVKNSE